MHGDQTARAGDRIVIPDLTFPRQGEVLESVVLEAEPSTEPAGKFPALRGVERDVQDGCRREAERLRQLLNASKELLQFGSWCLSRCGEFIMIAHAHRLTPFHSRRPREGEAVCFDYCRVPSEVVLQMPRPVPLGITEHDGVRGLTVPSDSIEDKDRQSLPFQVLPLDSQDRSSHELLVILPLDSRWFAHAAILRSFRSDDCVVALLALPFAHSRSPVICSDMSLDSGTKSTRTSPMVRSPGSEP